MLQKTYNWVMSLADHPRAKIALAIVSFTESSFFPIPPDPLYLAMALKKREAVWNLALLCTLTSVVGGFLGYAIGHGLYEVVGKPIIDMYGYGGSFQKMQEQFNKWGFWIVALKGLTPIPYKIVTIASGVSGLDLLTFTIASLIARGFRFYTLATLFWFYGAQLREYIERNLTLVTTVLVILLIGGYFVIKYLF